MNRPHPERIRKKQSRRLTWWPVAVALAGLLIVAVGVWWGLGQSAPPSRAPIQTPSTTSADPHLAVDRDTIDLGMQPFERPVSAVFQVQNVGGDTLRILAEPVVELVEGC
jgi:hypothetical protein